MQAFELSWFGLLIQLFGFHVVTVFLAQFQLFYLKLNYCHSTIDVAYLLNYKPVTTTVLDASTRWDGYAWNEQPSSPQSTPQFTIQYQHLPVQIDKFVMHCQPVRSNGSLKPPQFLCNKCAYLGLKKKESGKERESNSTNLVATFEDFMTQRTIRTLKELCILSAACTTFVQKACIL